MYPLMLAAILAQVTMFLRALRVGGLADYSAVVVLTALAIASNFAALLIPATEGLWLALYNRARRIAPRRPNAARVGDRDCARGGRIDSGAETFFFAARGFGGKPRRMAQSLPLGTSLSRCSTRPPAASHFRSSHCSRFGASIRGWHRGARDSIVFAFLWMWAPPLMMLVASYAIAPVFVERYALSCFVPFFILVALGIFELPGDLRRAPAALALAVAFSLGHIVSYDRKPHDAQYREAIAAADSALKPGEVMTVIPSYAIEVLRYYLPARSTRSRSSL